MLYYETRSHGEHAILLLHGFLGSGRNMASLARRLGEACPGFEIILPDLTGHGQSNALPNNADLHTVAQDVVALIEQLPHKKPVIVCGHSFGGRTALVAKAQAPALIQHVVLLDIGPSPVLHLSDGMRPAMERLMLAPDRAPNRLAMRTFFLEGGISEALTDWLLMSLITTAGEVVWRIDRQRLGDFHKRVSQTNLWSLLPACMPAGNLHLVRGALSHFVNDADYEQLHNMGVHTHTIDKAGHFLHVDNPDALLHILIDVVRQYTYV